MPTSTTIQQLEEAADGLLYPSETDEPLTAFHWSKATGDPTPEAVRKQGKHLAAAPVAVRTLEKFFEPLLQIKDWYEEEELANVARWQTLFDTVKSLLGKPTVVRIGEGEITIYLVGIASEGGWAGVQTKAVET